MWHVSWERLKVVQYRGTKECLSKFTLCKCLTALHWFKRATDSAKSETNNTQQTAAVSYLLIVRSCSYRVVAGGLLAVCDEFPLPFWVNPPEPPSRPSLWSLSLQKTVVHLAAVVHLQHTVNTLLRIAASTGFAATTFRSVGTARRLSLCAPVWDMWAWLWRAASQEIRLVDLRKIIC